MGGDRRWKGACSTCGPFGGSGNGTSLLFSPPCQATPHTFPSSCIFFSSSSFPFLLQRKRRKEKNHKDEKKKRRLEDVPDGGHEIGKALWWRRRRENVYLKTGTRVTISRSIILGNLAHLPIQSE